jgi:phosphatidylinositol-3-phosphatase
LRGQSNQNHVLGRFAVMKIRSNACRFFSLIVLVPVLMSVVVGSGCAGLGQPQPPCAATVSTADSPKIALVIFENQRYENMLNNPIAPFINSLIAQGGLATNYFANTHPSIGNYFELTVGNTISNDLFFTGQVDNVNIASEMCAAGISWKGYFENIPSVGYLGDRAVPYAKTHNPFAYFTNVIHSDEQRQKLVSLDQFTTDLQNGTLPQFIYLMGNQFHNMHDCEGVTDQVNCPNNDVRIAQGDAWLQQVIPPLLNDPGFAKNGVLLVTWDESVDTDVRNVGGHIVTLMVGANIKKGFQSTTFYQHQNLLRFMSDRLGIPAPGDAAGAADMSEFLVGH